MGDTKPPCKVGKPTIEFPGVRVSQIWGDKTLVLCQHGSPRAPRAFFSRPRRGSPFYLGRVTPVSSVRTVEMEKRFSPLAHVFTLRHTLSH
jgi:hypothetical protein